MWFSPLNLQESIFTRYLRPFFSLACTCQRQSTNKRCATKTNAGGRRPGCLRALTKNNAGVCGVNVDLRRLSRATLKPHARRHAREFEAKTLA